MLISTQLLYKIQLVLSKMKMVKIFNFGKGYI